MWNNFKVLKKFTANSLDTISNIESILEVSSEAYLWTYTMVKNKTKYVISQGLTFYIFVIIICDYLNTQNRYYKG